MARIRIFSSTVNVSTPSMNQPAIEAIADLVHAGESRAHSLLASRNLAPPLLARFDNGLLYKYIEGDVCSPEDLRRPEVYRAVAKRMGQWHSTLPISAISSAPSEKHASNGNGRNGDAGSKDTETARPVPNIWTVMQGWINALPTGTEAEKKQKQGLDEELAYITSKLANTPGMDGNDYVFSHCDLLSGNVIIEPSPESTLADGDAKHQPSTTVGFIDYEYATPGHAAFDIANHFAEWAGFECDHGAVPSRSQRLEFVRHYIESYRSHAKTDLDPSPEEVVTLMHQIDLFRGVPGFYWGIWALIQATISSIDFDYKAYAPLRLGEYWGAKAEMDGSRKASGAEMTKREKRWAEE